MAIHTTVGTTVSATAQVIFRSAWYRRRSDALQRLRRVPRGGRSARHA